MCEYKEKSLEERQTVEPVSTVLLGALTNMFQCKTTLHGVNVC